MSDSSPMKAPTRKASASARRPASKTARSHDEREEGGSSSPLGFILILVVCAAVGAAGMYFAMPLLASKAPEGGAPAAAAPAAGGPPGEAPALPVEGMKAGKIPMAQTLSVTATLRANESAVIKPEVSGRVMEIPFTEGAPVKKGDILFKMDGSVQKAALSQAQANVNVATNNAQRYKDLVGERAVSKSQYEQALAERNTANANVALAKANLDKMTIRAPFDGVAGIRNVSVGDVVDPTNELVSVTQTTPLRVIFDVPERFLPVVQAGSKVNFTVPSKPDTQFEATIVARDSMIDPVTRAVRVQATVPNEDGALLSGQFATLGFALSAPTEVLAIPDSAIIPEGGSFSVFKVGDGGAVEKVQVKTGLRDAAHVEILDGLADGDTVVTAGQQKLFPGMKVQIVPPSKITTAPPPEEESAQ